jgi:hypothetical protein
LSFADSAALITEILGDAAARPDAGALETTSKLADLAATARSARTRSEVLHAWSAATAQAAAATEDSVAETLDRLARQRPDDARIQAKSAAARRYAARQRRRAADLRSDRPSGSD